MECLGGNPEGNDTRVAVGQGRRIGLMNQHSTKWVCDVSLLRFRFEMRRNKEEL